MKLILLRHGQSKWNLENRFTGWQDVGLTEEGVQEAEFAAKQLIKQKIKIESVYTSLLKRASETAKIVTKIISFPYNKVHHEWRLNERHYGALQGLSKSETATKYGEKQVKIWRRSFDIPPPLLNKDDPRNPIFNKKFDKLNVELPLGESLKDVIIRLYPFWDIFTKEMISTQKNYMIIAHSNSLRAIIKILDRISEEEITSVEIPTGVPLIYTFTSSMEVLNKEYLLDKSELEKRQKEIVEQGKPK